ncbi:ferritin-like domain-containing protein [Desulfofundulus thermocisternus]|uniref:ferritin-like domain-containing protein n=1 Tax=Desulfofundulus thermocisternus TaxID=42471 RepID=UPI00217EAB6A|nr:ferritin family protein [Desulfofundulus thermocisternus]MCS5696835.1 ferritin family protein [Desulfofundulus thermocisternus]
MWFFRAREIVEFARQIEQKGQQFYRAMAEQAADGRVKEIMLALAAEEEEHEALFTRMLDGLENYNPPETYPGEYEEYVRALLDAHVFARDIKPGEIACEAGDPQKALDMAIGFEKDSLLFFYELRQLVPEQERSAVDKLIREEQKHILRLAGQKKVLA